MYRGILIVVFVTDFLISAYYRRKAKKSGRAISRKEEGSAALAARLAVALPLYGSLIAWMIEPAWMQWAALAVSEWIRFAGTILLIGTVPLTFWVMRTIGSNISETVLTKEEQKLVTTGPYRWIRHPLYTDGLLLFGGAVLVSGNWFLGAFTVLAGVAVLLFVIPKEEEQLIQTFGDQYVQYRQQTGRLIPRLRRPGKRSDAG
ncbi:MAG: isoprenylcysteine carboxylmethyltransferase family protein [Balneolaceae bacterium]|nr:isoprenylcysteine carboxylmethyltransferase family protein [Balneolaceae bacterium]